MRMIAMLNGPNPRRAHGSTLALLGFLAAAVYSTPAAGQPTITNVAMLGAAPQMSILGAVGTTNQIQSVTDLSQTNWVVLTNLVVTQSPYMFVDTVTSAGCQRFYRVVDPNWPTHGPPPGMSLIPAGTFQMGDTFNEGAYYELPVHTVYVSAFYMDKYEVTQALWGTVSAWSATNGYTYDYPGSAKGTNHPVESIDWYDMVKWCNARSQMQGRVPAYYTDAALTQVYRTGQIAPYVNWNAGYRLPTESEWEKAARGGASGHRFPWSDVDTISPSRANYYADTNAYLYDVSPTPGYNPAFATGEMPYTSPVGSFPPNGYGLYDMAGNAWEWCWDYAGPYPSEPQTDPSGPATDQGSGRVGRGGNWNYYAVDCRCAYRYGNSPNYTATNVGFRCALPVP
jgi:formylglycine-generating enzyme required for sulfatase activity